MVNGYTGNSELNWNILIVQKLESSTIRLILSPHFLRLQLYYQKVIKQIF